MAYTRSVLFAVILALIRVQADMTACRKVFEPQNFKKVCCQIDPAALEMGNQTNPYDVDICGISTTTQWTCEISTCILNQGGLIKKGKIDYKLTNESLEALIQNYPQTKAMAESVLKHCGEGKYEDKMPSEMCFATKYQACFFLAFVMECPKWSKDAECQKLAENIAKCSKLFD